MATKNNALQQKQGRFLSASHFAVVGASTNPAKNGSKALKFLLGQHKDVVPINPNATTDIQGLKCLKALSELPDPTHTSVSIVVPPNVTLDILKQAKALNVFALWLQPGAEDDAVEKFIQADPQFEERCIYNSHALHEHAPTPSRTRSKPEPLATSTNLPSPDTLPPCLFRGDPTLNPVAAAATTLVSAAVAAAPISTLDQKRQFFLSAPHFAVVGASTSETKKWNEAHTSVSIVVPPHVTLEVMKLAKSLGIYAVWIQPGAEDDAVVEFIEADPQLKARCVYREHSLHEHPLHTTTHSPMVMLATNSTLHTDTLGPCLFAEPTVSAAATVPAAAPLVASNVAAGIKRTLSPPSTPPVNKSLKLSPDTDLGDEIPGLA
ncbi:CoA-binding domain-containing protein [Mycena venus]|uniref:CoA-binding domain-containing protein n=1 Tax=Mycena venus TaxID=2733690 RepID=A0A8H7D8I8_9AGAR|nr:CoA-binding domain-containing protein [Mycena venus]